MKQSPQGRPVEVRIDDPLKHRQIALPRGLWLGLLALFGLTAALNLALLRDATLAPWELASDLPILLCVGGALFLLLSGKVRWVGNAAENIHHFDDAEQARDTAERLQAVTAALSGALTPAEVAAAVIDEALPALGVDAGAVYALADQGTDLTLLSYRGYAREAEAEYTRIPVARPGPLGDALRSGDLVVVESADDLIRRWPRLAGQQAIAGDASLLVAPLLLNGRSLGVLHLAFRTARRFSMAERAFVLTLARQCAQALERARLYEAEQQARTRAETAQEQREAIFEAMTDGVFVFGHGGSVLHTNGAARDLFALTGPPEAYTPPLQERGYQTRVRDEEKHPLPEQQWPLFRILQGEQLTGPSTVDLMVHLADGRDLALSVTGAPMRTPEGEISGAVCVVRDVSERHRLERHTHDALSALLQMAETLVLRGQDSTDDASDIGQQAQDRETAGTAQAVTQRLAELTCRVLGCQRVAISAVDPASGEVQPLAGAGLTLDQERQWRAGNSLHARLARQGGDPALRARLQNGEVLVLDFTQPPLLDGPNPFGLRTLLLAPMQVGQQLIGVLSLDHGGAEHTYTAEEQALTGVVAKLAGLVIERERLLRDRAESRATELALRQANQRMDEFLNIASHELKTPLTSLKGMVQLAQRRVRKAAETSMQTPSTTLEAIGDLLARTDRQLTRMDGLVSDLLDISRINAGQLALRVAPCDLAGIVRESIEEQQAAWPERTIMFDRDDNNDVLVVADKERIAQVVTNFLTNALKYSSADRGVTVTLRQEGTEARVSVRDAGPGIAAADQAQIWERFYRVKGIDPQSGSGLGLGLGLHICRTIVTRHSGQVGVQSTPGQGSTFWFSLPLTG